MAQVRRAMLMTLLAATAACGGPAVTSVGDADIRRLIDEGPRHITLLHFWATWCPPCVREFPEIVALQKKYGDRGLRVLLVSADAPKDATAVTAFLAKHGAGGPAYMAANVNDAFIQAISPRWSGALPASFYYGADGRLVTEWEGAQPFSKHEDTVRTLLDDNQAKGEGTP